MTNEINIIIFKGKRTATFCPKYFAEPCRKSLNKVIGKGKEIVELVKKYFSGSLHTLFFLYVKKHAYGKYKQNATKC